MPATFKDETLNNNSGGGREQAGMLIGHAVYTLHTARISLWNSLRPQGSVHEGSVSQDVYLNCFYN